MPSDEWNEYGRRKVKERKGNKKVLEGWNKIISS